MTSNEMRRLFKLFYDGASPVEMGFDDREVGTFLTTAMNLEIERGFFPNRNPFLEGYEIGALRDNQFVELKERCYIYNDLTAGNSVMVRESGNTNLTAWKSGILPNTTIIELPTDFLYFSFDSVDITYSGRKLKDVQVKSLNEDNFQEVLGNNFTRPNHRVIYRNLVERLDSGRSNILNRTSRRCLLITDNNTTIDRYMLSYIRRPNDIVVDIFIDANQRNCELDESFHLSIVRRAVMLALGSIASDKYQISYTEKTIND
jgi:hypothetical protein